MPIRILHVMDSLGNGGLENGVVNLIRHMDARRYEHAICTIRGLGVNADRLPPGRVRLLQTGKRPGFDWQIPELRRAIRETRPDVVHSRNWGAIEAVMAGRLAGRCALVHSEHGLESSAATREPWRRICFRRLAFELAHSVFCVSRQLRDFHARRTGFAARRISVIHNGVDSMRFSPDPAARARMRRELEIGEKEFCVGAVGNLLPVKDHLTLLEAVNRLGGAARDWRVLVAGEGSESPKLAAAASAMPGGAQRITFLGASSRVSELLNAFDVYVLPSLNEGISNSLLEAMATGLPVIATATGGNPEVVEDGRSGLLFPPGNAPGLGEGLMRLYSEPQLGAELGAAARRRVREEFSIESMVANYEKLYERVTPVAQPADVEVQA